MEITYAGDGGFSIKGSRTVAINNPATERADITLFSTRQRSKTLITNGPGEYEIGDVLITTVHAGPREAGAWAHAVSMDGINILYLDRNPGLLDDQALMAVGKVDVLIVNADSALVAQTAARDLGARVVLPFGAEADKVCAALDVKDAQPQIRFSWNGAAKVEKAVLLKAPARRKSKAA